MGRIQFFLNDDFKHRPQMYVGDTDFRSVTLWLCGYDAACRAAFPDEISDFLGFKEWLLIRVGGPSNVGWQGIISEKYGVDQNATEVFFDLFDKFRSDVDASGLKQILKDHFDFEIREYGSVRVSEYFSRGWNKRLPDVKRE